MPVISLDQDSYEELENTTLVIIIRRSGDFSQPLTVYLTLTTVTTDNAAIGKISSSYQYIVHHHYAYACLAGEDFVPETRELVISEASTIVPIDFIDDVFPEAAEQFEIFLSAAPGGLVVAPAYATVTILNDDPPLPGIAGDSYTNNGYNAMVSIIATQIFKQSLLIYTCLSVTGIVLYSQW